MSTPNFRTATHDDIPALLTLVTSAYRGEESRAGWTSEADLIEGARLDAAALEADLARPRSSILLAERGDQLVACAHVADDHGNGYFGMFSVDPNQQGGGVGKLVLAEAEAYAAREWGVSVMQMTVIDVREELIAFYERRGYVRTGITKPFPYGEERFGIPQRDDLRFEVLEKTLASTEQHPESNDATTLAPEGVIQ
ncbi:GNAT family N-acetyltransferase [Salinibacterium sp. SWN1162]|uniref:GNAT family N-acetyltransferase n=1 Tax=Salinibacterium sp. SWN1162 TaxID=2792053 RepID=UPI001E45AFBE|nr:GNAT family N-acetyltransferase [Salinibacterium sp. SWN1162]